jgi:uncharacterized protein (TIGR00255 family)
MTGYGAAQATGSRLAVEIEIRSVNARALKTSLRIPPVLAPREPEIDKLVRGSLRRGSVTVYVRLDFLRPQDLVRIREDVVEGFAKAVAKLRRKGLVEGPLTVDALATLPGAVESGAEDPLRPADWKVVQGAVREALAALDAMRRREAAHLVKDLRAIVRRMRTTLGKVKRRAPSVVAEHRKKLQDRVAQLLAGSAASLDETTLAREVAVFADRSDITEEITRLAAHLDEFEKYLAEDQEVGRTLDFLSQEMLRETNTIGSKSGDVTIARAVITLKSDVDRLKEQVANLE